MTTEAPPAPAAADGRPKVLLYVDDSRHWEPPARLLSEYVRQTGGSVVVTSAMLLPGSRARLLQHAKEVLALPDDRVELLGKPGLIEYTLPELAREQDADLVVVGRLGSADRLTNGLIAHLIVKRCPCSVLIARGKPQRLRSIVVCTEGAAHGMRNFERAAGVAIAFGARLTVLHVVSQMGLTDRGQEELEEDLRDFVASDAPEAEHLREVRDRMREKGLEGSVEVRAGLVVEEILHAIHEGGHDLLVIGAHDTGDRGDLYEDLASHILRASTISTLVVRERPSGGRE